MSARRRGGDDDRGGGERGAFEEAMRGVRPLPGRDKLVPPPEPQPGARSARPSDTEPVRFEVEHAGETVRGLAPGIDRRALRRLARGGVEVDARADLHGLGEAEALRALREAFRAALADGARCVLVVHGRGLHSEDRPVLKQAFLRWLAEPPHGPRVMAFASALPRDGGPGATYVLLRRRR